MVQLTDIKYQISETEVWTGVASCGGTTPPPAGGTPPKRGIGRGLDESWTQVGRRLRGCRIFTNAETKFPSWEGWRVAPGWFPRAVRGRIPRPNPRL
ncbi:MAG: hypothetical protein LBM98_04710 [Oscillospiraceae bacterium]|nr:hypothetical protein [Oscillospiraceae bacterium]